MTRIDANNGSTLHDPETAQRMADELQAGDSDFIYDVEVYDSGLARVVVFDDEGVRVGYFD